MPPAPRSVVWDQSIEARTAGVPGCRQTDGAQSHLCRVFGGFGPVVICCANLTAAQGVATEFAITFLAEDVVVVRARVSCGLVRSAPQSMQQGLPSRSPT